MKQLSAKTYRFRLGRMAYRHNGFLSLLLLGGFVLCGLLTAAIALWFFPTYTHAFTPYLKWQDVLVALCCFITFISFGGCVLITRFLYALYAGHTKEMVTLSDTALVVRDLSHENLSGIFWLISTALTCFLTALLGVIPEMLLVWTLHLSSPLLAIFATGLVLVLSVAGLVLTLPFLSFIVIGIVGSVSFCRKMGSPQVYHLTSQATLSIDSFVLTIIYPDTPETMIDLNILEADDQRHLLHLLLECWIGAQRPWNPSFGEEIVAALAETEHSAVLV
jgi:hypothetical protein